jgi:hypothetical protein
MAEFVNEKLGARFTVPDRLTVRQQLAYYGARQFDSGSEAYVAHWRASVPLLGDWNCPLLPDPAKADLDQLTDPQVTQLIMWAANGVAGHVLRLETIPKG